MLAPLAAVPRAAVRGAAVARAVVAVARDVARLVVPVECPGCGLADVRWCEECEALWWEQPVRCESGAPRLVRVSTTTPVWAAAALEGPAHGMVAAWKDGGRRDLDGFFRRAAARLAEAVADSLPEALVVVPAPSRPRSVRARGEDLPALLADAVAAALRREGTSARVVGALRIGAGEQRHASARGRWSQAASMRLARPLPAGWPVLLVDDVVTTGATLASASSALPRDLNPLVGALVLAHAPTPGAKRVTPTGTGAEAGLW